MKKEMNCIVCPMGCLIVVEGNEEGEIVSITGNTCKRGEDYVRSELTHPMRRLTSTVRITGSRNCRLPVSLSGDIPKERMFDVMREINRICVSAPVMAGQVLLEDVCGLEVNVVASRTMKS